MIHGLDRAKLRMSARLVKKDSTPLASCATLATDDGEREAEQDEKIARDKKLEAIERQLHYLIGQVRSLKTT